MPSSKCPPSLVVIVNAKGEAVACPADADYYALLRGSSDDIVVEYIPRHIADQQARDAVRLAVELERAAQHREDGE